MIRGFKDLPPHEAIGYTVIFLLLVASILGDTDAKPEGVDRGTASRAQAILRESMNESMKQQQAR